MTPALFGVFGDVDLPRNSLFNGSPGRYNNADGEPCEAVVYATAGGWWGVSLVPIKGEE